MSRKIPIEHACTHPEVIAIGVEVTLDPDRRRHYSPLVLMLADAAMQEMVRKINGEPPVSSAAKPDAPNESATGE
jgi:hypothetical protein